MRTWSYVVALALACLVPACAPSEEDGVGSEEQDLKTPGTLDPKYGKQGVAELALPEYSGFNPPGRLEIASTQALHRSAIVLASGKVVVALDGMNPDLATGVYTRLYRLNKNGKLDTTFGDHGHTDIDDMYGVDLFEAAGGKVLVTFKSGFLRLDAHGHPDATFGNAGLKAIDLGFDVSREAFRILPDGANGWFAFRDADFVTQQPGRVYHLDADGDVDHAFAAGQGYVEGSYDWGVPAGIGGALYMKHSVRPGEMYVTRYVNGVLDSTFDLTLEGDGRRGGSMMFDLGNGKIALTTDGDQDGGELTVFDTQAHEIGSYKHHGGYLTGAGSTVMAWTELDGDIERVDARGRDPDFRAHARGGIETMAAGPDAVYTFKVHRDDPVGAQEHHPYLRVTKFFR